MHCARDHAWKYRLPAAYHRASWRTRSHNVLLVPALQQFPSGRLRLVALWEKDHKVVVRFFWGKIRLEATNRLLLVLTGERFEQAKVFKAHAVPQGLSANLINALKLLANQQEDGDALLQNVVKDLGKESRRSLTNGLSEIIKVDSERVLDVGSLSRGTRTFQVRKPKSARRVLGGDSQGEPGRVDVEG